MPSTAVGECWTWVYDRRPLSPLAVPLDGTMELGHSLRLHRLVVTRLVVTRSPLLARLHSSQGQRLSDPQGKSIPNHGNLASMDPAEG